MFTKNFDFNYRRDHQKISYERRAYESVGRRKEHILGYVTKNDRKKIGRIKINEVKLTFILTEIRTLVSNLLFYRNIETILAIIASFDEI